jgi:hypothetical protein
MHASGGKNLDDISVINVTTAVNNGATTSLATNMKIPVGSSWTWKGYSHPDYTSPYNVELNFQNMPDHEGYLFSSKWSYRGSYSGALTNPYSMLFFETPMNLYLKLNTTNDGIKYIWLNDVVAGNRQVDLSNMNTANEKTIDMAGANGYRKYLSGILNPSHRYEGRYMLDNGYDNSNSVNSVKVHYPENSFSEYKTGLYYYNELDNRYDFYYQATYGSIPDAFTKINADFNFVSTTYDNYEISASGDFIQNRSFWLSDSGSWFIYSDNTTLKYNLPKLPNSVVQLFGVNREAFTLRYADLLTHSTLNSYSDIIDILFNSDSYFYDVVNDVRARVKYINSKDMPNKEVYHEFDELNQIHNIR